MIRDPVGPQHRRSDRPPRGTGRPRAPAVAALAARIGPTDAANPHTDLASARAATLRALTGPPAPATDAALAAVPCYMSLFVYDWVTAACACATFTTDDHLVPGLQVPPGCPAWKCPVHPPTTHIQAPHPLLPNRHTWSPASRRPLSPC